MKVIAWPKEKVPHSNGLDKAQIYIAWTMAEITTWHCLYRDILQIE
jgi:hypothetical protein